MCYSKSPEVFNSVDQLLEQSARLLLFKVVFGSDVVEKLTIAAVFHNKEEALGGLDNLIQLNDGRMAYNL